VNYTPRSTKPGKRCAPISGAPMTQPLQTLDGYSRSWEVSEKSTDHYDLAIAALEGAVILYTTRRAKRSEPAGLS
jgi:hypothetical protein